MPGSVLSPLGGLSMLMFELYENLLDGIEVGL